MELPSYFALKTKKTSQKSTFFEIKRTFWVKQRSSKAFSREMKITKQIKQYTSTFIFLHLYKSLTSTILPQRRKNNKGKKERKAKQKKRRKKNSITIASQAMCSIKKNLCLLRNRSVIIGVKKKKKKKMACQLPNFKFFSIFIHNNTCIAVPSNYRNCNNTAKYTNTISAKIHILSILKITVPIIFQKTFKINPRNNMDVSSAFIKFHSSRSNAIQSKLSKHLKKKTKWYDFYTRFFKCALSQAFFTSDFLQAFFVSVLHFPIKIALGFFSRI